MLPKMSLILLCAGGIAGSLWGAGTRNLSVQYAVKTDSEIKVDGKLTGTVLREDCVKVIEELNSVILG